MLKCSSNVHIRNYTIIIIIVGILLLFIVKRLFFLWVLITFIVIISSWICKSIKNSTLLFISYDVCAKYFIKVFSIFIISYYDMMLVK